MIRRIFKHISTIYFKSSPQRYVKYLRKKGMTIGEHVSILSCNKCHIDEGRASFINIGSNVVICTGVTILGHDYSWYVFKEAFNDIVPSGGGHVIIGNNVFLGENSTILRNVKIGDNCIIGAGAVVTKDIPDNSVAAGVPAKVIMSLKQYYDLKKDTIFDEIEQNIKDIYMLKGRLPYENEMANFRVFYMPRTRENFDKILKSNILAGTPERDIELFKHNQQIFESYEQMLTYFDAKMNVK